MSDLTERLRNRIHDSQMDNEHMMDDAIDALEAQEARIRTLEKALKDSADDIDLEAKYASRSGQMASLEEIANVMRSTLTPSLPK